MHCQSLLPSKIAYGGSPLGPSVFPGIDYLGYTCLPIAFLFELAIKRGHLQLHFNTCHDCGTRHGEAGVDLIVLGKEILAMDEEF